MSDVAVAGVMSLALYHGSRVGDLKHLDAECFDEEAPFGPGLYMSEDQDVALTYARDQGALYRVCISGSVLGVIDLCLPWESQSYLALAAAIRLFMMAGLERPRNFLGDQARDSLEVCGRAVGKRARNQFLAKQGIWLMHGVLDVVEVSGTADRGVQYLLVDTRCVERLQIVRSVRGVW